jgi:hypothetical protein
MEPVTHTRPWITGNYMEASYLRQLAIYDPVTHRLPWITGDYNNNNFNLFLNY